MKRPPRPEGPRTTIGWREYIALPEWNVPYLKAKADTGARTSAIDVADIEEIGDGRVRFHLVIDRRTADARQEVEADIVRRSRVKSSFGASHDRLIVRTRLVLGPVDKMIDLSLVCRRNMLCRMLLGRTALEPEFLVDSAHRYLFGLKPRKAMRTGTATTRGNRR